MQSSASDVEITHLLEAPPGAWQQQSNFHVEQRTDPELKICDYLKSRVLPSDDKEARKVAAQAQSFAVQDQILYYAEPFNPVSKLAELRTDDDVYELLPFSGTWDSVSSSGTLDGAKRSYLRVGHDAGPGYFWRLKGHARSNGQREPGVSTRATWTVVIVVQRPHRRRYGWPFGRKKLYSVRQPEILLKGASDQEKV